MTHRFFDQLNYSSVNEDWRTERRALQIGSDDRVLCVAGSGDRPLNLLVDDPECVVAVDCSPSQIRLLQLKLAALRALPYSEYVGFLGLTESSSRQDTWLGLSPDLHRVEREFWGERLPMLRRGVLYRGRWERYYQKLAGLVSLIRGSDVRTLFEIEDLREQRTFVRETWNTRWWRALLDVLCCPVFSKLFFGDPAFFAHVPRSFGVGAYVHGGMLGILDEYLARDNFMLALLLQGRLLDSDLPPYLSENTTPLIRNRIDRVEPLQADLFEVLETCEPGSFTRLSLSDTPSFLDQAGFERLLNGVVRASAPGARVCIRQFLTDHTMPERFGDKIIREPQLEKELRAEDRAFAYRFIVGEVCS